MPVESRLKAYSKKVKEILGREDFIRGLSYSEQEAVKAEFKRRIAELADEEAGEFERQAEGVMRTDEAERAQETAEKQKNTSDGRFVLNALARGLVAMPSNVVALLAQGVDTVGAKNAAMILDQYAKDTDYDMAQSFVAAPEDSSYILRVLEAAAENAPAMVATGLGTKALLSGAGRLGVTSGRAVKALEVAGTAAGMSVPELRKGSVQTNRYGSVLPVKHPSAVLAGAVPHALIETGMGVTPLGLVGGSDKAGLFKKGFSELLARYQRRYGSKAAGQLVLNRLMTETPLGEGMEEVLQNPVGALTRNMANNNLSTALQKTGDELTKPGYLSQLGEDFMLGAGVGAVYSGAKALRVREKLDEKIEDPKTPVTEKQQLAMAKERLQIENRALLQLPYAGDASTVLPDGSPVVDIPGVAVNDPRRRAIVSILPDGSPVYDESDARLTSPALVERPMLGQTELAGLLPAPRGRVEPLKRGGYDRMTVRVDGVQIPTDNRTLLHGNSEAASRIEKKLPQQPNVHLPTEAKTTEPPAYVKPSTTDASARTARTPRTPRKSAASSLDQSQADLRRERQTNTARRARTAAGATDDAANRKAESITGAKIPTAQAADPVSAEDPYYTDLAKKAEQQETPEPGKKPLYSAEYIVAKYAAAGLNKSSQIVRRGLELIKHAGGTFAKWARQMVKEFGRMVKKHLRNLWIDLGRTGAISGRPGGLKNNEPIQSSPVHGKTAHETLTAKWTKKGLEKAYRFGDKLYKAGETTFAEWKKYMQQRFNGIKEPELRDLWQNVKTPDAVLQPKPPRDKNVPASPVAKILGAKEGSATVETESNQAQVDAKAASTKTDTPSGQKVKDGDNALELKRYATARDFVWRKVDKNTYELDLTDPNTGKTSVVETIRRPKEASTMWNVDNWLDFRQPDTVGGAFNSLATAKAALKTHAREAFNQRTTRENAVIKDRIKDAKAAKAREKALEKDKKRDEREAKQAAERKKKAEEYIAEGKNRPVETEPEKPKTWRDYAKNFVNRAEEVLFDAWAPVKQLQAAIVKRQDGKELPEELDLYNKLEIAAGKIEAGTRIFKEKNFVPIKNYLIDNKIPVKKFNRFLAIMHAKERNDSVAKKNETFRITGAPGSGISTEQAKKEIRQHHKDGTFDTYMKAAIMTYRLNRLLLDQQVIYGLLSKKQRHAYRRYRYYTPLKRPPDQGLILDKAALGRRSEATDQLSYIEKAIDTVFRRGERKLVIDTAVNLFTQHPDSKLYREFTPPKVQYQDARGKIRLRTDTSKLFNSPNVIWTKDPDAKTYRAFEIKDAALNEAINRPYTDLGPEQKFFRFFARINRILAGLSTAYNPEFIYTNPFRDIQQGAASIGVNLPEGSVQKFMSNLGRAKKAIADAKAGKATPDAKLLEEFQLAGGKTGYSEFSKLEDSARDLDREITEAQTGGRWYRVKENVKKAANWVADWNDAMETLTRFAGYMTAKEAGFSAQKSAALAKNMTVNFNKKGTWAPVFNSLYLFSSVSLGGTLATMNVIRKAWRTSKGKAMIAGAIGLGFALEFLNSVLAGDDDEDGVNYYDKLPGYIKDNNYVLMIPGTKGKYVSIPMPYGLNVLPSIGRNMAASMAGKQSFSAGLGNSVFSLLNSFNPIGGDTRGLGFQLVPTAVRPFVDIATNTTWTGRKIRPEQPAFGSKVAHSELYFAQNSKILRGIAKTLNELTGGDQYTSGFASFSPADVEHLIESYLSGVGRVLSRSADTLARPLAGEAPELGNIPVLRRFSGSATEYSTRQTFKENAETVEDFERARRERDTGYLKSNRHLLSAVALYKSVGKRVTAIRKHSGLSEAEKQDRILVIQKRFNKKFREIKNKALSKK